jgi:dTDP-4-dehydrorhamnose reductase
MKILITGENGYIAKSLYESLKDKYNITAIGRKNFDLTNYKLLDSYLKHTYFDVVIHCAVTGGSRLKTDTFGDMDNNLKMYYNLLNCNDRFGKLIHFGSGAEIHSPESPYGLSKRVIAKSISEIDNFYNIRIYAVFDENELDTRFIKSNIKRYINKEPMLVQNKKMSFFYMKDLVTLVNHYIQSSSSSLLKESNCAYVNSTSLLDIANIINELEDYKVPIYMDTSLSEDYESKLNAPYGLKYIGLTHGIIETYNKLKYE